MSLTVEKCLQAWTNTIRQMEIKTDLVFFGDSLTYHGDFATAFPDMVVGNLGLRGDTIEGMIDRVGQVSLLDPDMVFLMAGINDVRSCPIDSFYQLYNRLVDSILQNSPRVPLIIQSILPVNTQEFSISCNNDQIRLCNRVIESIAMSKNLQFIDLYACYEVAGQLPLSFTRDGIHLLPEAYGIWYDAVNKVIMNS